PKTKLMRTSTAHEQAATTRKNQEKEEEEEEETRVRCGWEESKTPVCMWETQCMCARARGNYRGVQESGQAQSGPQEELEDPLGGSQVQRRASSDRQGDFLSCGVERKKEGRGQKEEKGGGGGALSS
ncbi:unnamed protein product, partial [Prorocentrum cordatum]